MVDLQSADLSKLLRIIVPLPILKNERGREAVVESASLQQLLPQLDLSGESAVAIPLMIKVFTSFGRLTYEHEALGRFLSTLTDYVGLEDRAVLEGIISKYHLMIPVATSPEVSDWVAPVTTSDVLEKVIGENTLRPVAFLQKGLNASRSVAYIRVSNGVREWTGTGFLVGSNLLLTNHHVLPARNLLSATICRFNYQLDTEGNAEVYEDYHVIADGHFHSNQALDYSILELSDNPGANWGNLALKPTIPTMDSRVNIIQHPSGLPKQISIHNNFVKFANHTKIQYVTSTLPGSSGSPVLDDDWRVVGIHHAGGMLPENDASLLYFRNEAVTVAAILEDLPVELRRRLTIEAS